MKSQFFTLLLLVVTVSIAVAMGPWHWQCRGCNCQTEGERGGHCHCPRDMPGVYCRWGGGHAICFPFWPGVSKHDAQRHLGCVGAREVYG